MGPRGWDERRFGLASLDALGDPDDLRAQAEQALLQAGGQVAQADYYEGVDSAGTVQVVVDRRGRVANIDINRRWKQLIRVDEFAPLLFQCYVSAVGASMDAVALADLAAEAEPQPEDPSVPRPRDPEPERELSEEEWLRRIWAQLYEVEDQQRQIEEMERTGQPDERAVSGPDGLVTLRLQGATLIAIDGNLRLMATADASELRFDVLAAFEAAGLTADDS